MRVLGEGRFLRLIERNGWELVERPGVEAVVAVVACTEDDELVLVEQYREPLRARVVELPAGLVGDDPGQAEESLETAARRELLEETGFDAESFEVLASGPPSAGQSSEVVTLLRARGVVRTCPGGGVDNEAIETHLVPRSVLVEWLERRRREGRWIPLPVPRAALVAADSLWRATSKLELDREQLDYLSYGRVMDTARMRNELGYAPKWTTGEAFDDYVRGRGLTPIVDPRWIRSVENRAVAAAQRWGR